MPSPQAQTGRTRIVVTVALVVLIGGAGGIVLPRLLHEATPPTPSTVQAEICLGLPPGGLEAAGTVRMTAKRSGLPRFVLEEAVPVGVTTEQVVGLLAAACKGTGWGEDAPSVNGTCLSFAAVTSVGGDPGTTEASMSWSMSARPGQALALRIRLAGGPTSTVEGAEIRIALSGRGVLREGETARGAGTAAYTAPWEKAAAVLRGLGEALRDAEWTAEEEETGALVVRSLPHTEALGSAILTVEYDAPDDAAAAPYAWTLELVR